MTDTDTAIKVSNLSKRYRIGRKEEVHDTFAGMLAASIRGPIQNLRRLRRLTSFSENGRDPEDILWALKDVSFEVKRGEIVGVIGRNGAGKSTLLKILSRITHPTSGRFQMRGRVSSLLEVGTGFHPELTGRENIYLNGTILGMRKAEIDHKFDEIVDFSGVEQFIDTPVKRYSSGMRVRLAFSVAAHLEPEILLVDEVLAVGDVEFQKKCLGKMGQVASEGRTVLFVSHNMVSIEKLCGRGIFLRNGKVAYSGTQYEAIGAYLNSVKPNGTSLIERKDRKGTGDINIVGIELKSIQGEVLDKVKTGQDVDFYLNYKKKSNIKFASIIVGIAVKTPLDIPVFLQHNRMTGDHFGELPEKGAFVLRLKRLPLPAATYRLTYSLIQDGIYVDALTDAAEFEVIGGDYYYSGEIPPISHGVCLVDGHWRLEAEPLKRIQTEQM